MNRQNHLALALVLSTTILLIGVALLAMCTVHLRLIYTCRSRQNNHWSRHANHRCRNAICRRKPHHRWNHPRHHLPPLYKPILS